MEHDPCSTMPPLSEGGIACPICGSATVVQKNRQPRHRSRAPVRTLIDQLVFHHHGCPICGISFRVSVSELLRKKLFPKQEEQERRLLPELNAENAYVPRRIADSSLLVSRAAPQLHVEPLPTVKPAFRLEVHQPFLGLNLELTLGGSRIPDSVKALVCAACRTAREACGALYELMRNQPPATAYQPAPESRSLPPEPPQERISTATDRDDELGAHFLNDCPSVHSVNHPEGLEI